MQLQNKQSPWKTIMTIKLKKKKKHKTNKQTNKQTNKND